MAKKMLIDAAHPEETRVVVISGNRVEEFDYEAAAKRQLRGNIYLAKVTRVEPSLQAAFVDYGGNRHGFLPFSEIHPDYYQIPVADRESLLAQQAEEDRSAAEAEDAAEAEAEAAGAAGRSAKTTQDSSSNSEDEPAEDSEATVPDDGSELAEEGETSEKDEDIAEASSDDDVESVGAEDALEEVPVRQTRRQRSYKIQEVIKRRQILLVQVVKEERGTKGAALTTYLSLAGRYCVLMPNTARGGGISRKITHIADRKRLKKLVADLEVPEGMGLIVRTAGANRTKAEIRRDFEYLIRLWENIRELTLQSTAPTIIYEEGSLVKRSIRDLYSKDIESVQVDGEEGYREAKDLMRMLMPSHAKKVQPYKDRFPLFQRYKIEQQLDAMFSPEVQLKSGGYIVINPTEALVSIDVNSGRSTREHSIEETALSTNLEAAEEIARQLRLRDLAGLVVIDFIDMEHPRNNRAIERKLKDALKSDRARIQVGRISHFGLLEMSRQRLRASLFEGSMQVCPSCGGTGHIRSVESTSLQVLRALEEEGLRERSSACSVEVAPDVALYILNQKRMALADIEQRFGMSVVVDANALLKSDVFELRRTARTKEDQVRRDESVISVESGFSEEMATETAEPTHDDEEEKPSKRRRRRKKPRSRKAEASAETESEETPEELNAEEVEAEAQRSAEPETVAEELVDEDSSGGRKRRPRRRGKRGGRRTRRSPGDSAADDTTLADSESQTNADSDDSGKTEVADVAPITEPQTPYVAYSTSSEPPDNGDSGAPKAPNGDPDRPEEAESGENDTISTIEASPNEISDASRDAGEAPQAPEEPAADEPAAPKRQGWWQRRAT